jgi:hypothetical protein
MIREAIQNIHESKKTAVTIDGDYEDKLDFLDANGGYESMDQWAHKELGIKSTYDSKRGVSTYEVDKKQLQKLRTALPQSLKITQVDDVVDFGKINKKQDFDKLSAAGKLAFVYNWLSGKTDIQPSNIDDLKFKITNHHASFKSKSASVDTGTLSDSGLDSLPFDMDFSELKKISKEL